MADARKQEEFTLDSSKRQDITTTVISCHLQIYTNVEMGSIGLGMALVNNGIANHRQVIVAQAPSDKADTRRMIVSPSYRLA